MATSIQQDPPSGSTFYNCLKNIHSKLSWCCVSSLSYIYKQKEGNHFWLNGLMVGRIYIERSAGYSETGGAYCSPTVDKMEATSSSSS